MSASRLHRASCCPGVTLLPCGWSVTCPIHVPFHDAAFCEVPKVSALRDVCRLSWWVNTEELCGAGKAGSGTEATELKVSCAPVQACALLSFHKYFGFFKHLSFVFS